MRFAVITVALVLVAPAHVAPADAGPRKGKIVRVERPRTGARGTPRFCNLNPTDSSATCFGAAPAVGDSASIVSNEGIQGHARVTAIQVQSPSGQSGAACTQGLWRAEVELSDVDRNNPNAIGYSSWLVFDVGLSPGAKITDPPLELPSGEAGESAAVSVDRDGEAPADFLVTWYPCQAKAPTSNAQAYCIDYWFASDGKTWSKSRQDIVSWCM